MTNTDNGGQSNGNGSQEDGRGLGSMLSHLRREGCSLYRCLLTLLLFRSPRDRRYRGGFCGRRAHDCSLHHLVQKNQAVSEESSLRYDG